jgi:hypothetical protein
MAAGYHDFASGEVLTAANLEDYCQNQSVLRFASAAARDTAVSGILTEGLMAYLIDTNSMCVYSGAAWSTIGPVHGTLTAWTPTVTQSGSVTVTVTEGTYQRIGRRITATAQLTVTGSGTGGNGIVVSLPVTARISPYSPMGVFMVFDTSVSTWYQGGAVTNNTTSCIGYINGTTAAMGVAGFTAGLAAGDLVQVNLSYEAVADA